MKEAQGTPTRHVYLTQNTSTAILGASDTPRRRY